MKLPFESHAPRNKIQQAARLRQIGSRKGNPCERMGTQRLKRSLGSLGVSRGPGPASWRRGTCWKTSSIVVKPASNWAAWQRCGCLRDLENLPDGWGHAGSSGGENRRLVGRQGGRCRTKVGEQLVHGFRWLCYTRAIRHERKTESRQAAAWLIGDTESDQRRWESLQLPLRTPGNRSYSLMKAMRWRQHRMSPCSGSTRAASF